MARPRKTIDPKRVIHLASIGHTMKEIAALENVSEDTLKRRFADACEKGRTVAAALIRRKQFEKALSGNGDTTMLIWLGKQLLGQKDKHEVDTNWPERLGYGGLPVPERQAELERTDKPN
jgi:lambda repressor-like predicted transcriptional regulator